MKKILPLALLGIAISTGAFAVDGTINIQGKVIDESCTIDGNSSRPVDKLVVLPTVSKSALASAGAVAGSRKFDFVLTNCPAKTINVYFEPSHVNVLANGHLKNTEPAATAAGNVEVQFLNNAGAPINLRDGSGNTQTVTVAAAGGGGTLSYFAQYYATGAATAGDVKSAITYSLEYN
ncbi:fimbrial protein [Pseudomonas schmalbachii]|uniref:Type 1 fimbrial protein n=1 Tax=Pseudomonas schmalbachii TaxID=2816993 RepID=A0ABS3TRM6_9PSED|nr:fimbrial protein [Pseudomonas schmalbachii]MBO3275234.1 type 1 fimbrial protein [Pseudomonas schmalbachii]